jgi:flagellar basal-body rod protein FlgF
MDEAIYMAASGALAQELRLGVLANNLSNVNTAGFKEDKAIFKSYLPDSPETANKDIQAAASAGAGTNTFALSSEEFYTTLEGTKVNFSLGEIKTTGNPLDFALNGMGFFAVETPDGVSYTRQGSFTIDQANTLVTQEGFPVLGEKGKIIIQGQKVSVDPEGNISVDGVLADKLKVVDFSSRELLRKVGNTQFIPEGTETTPNKAENVEVKQGSLELSNVNAVKSMTEMIEVHRAYEAYQKVIQSLSEINAALINQVGSID